MGRFLVIIPALAIAGSLVAKKTVPASAGTFPTDGSLFVGLLVGVILIVGGLTFFPALALGPIVEHLAMTSGRHSRADDHGSQLPAVRNLKPRAGDLPRGAKKRCALPTSSWR